MYIDAKTLIELAALLTALGVIGGAALWAVKFVDRQKKQDQELTAIRKEQTLICYGVMACLRLPARRRDHAQRGAGSAVHLRQRLGTHHGKRRAVCGLCRRWDQSPDQSVSHPGRSHHYPGHLREDRCGEGAVDYGGGNGGREYGAVRP